MWLLYQLSLGLLLLLAAPWLLLRRGSHYLTTLPGRLTFHLPPADGPRPLWIHAVSVGEVAVAEILVRALPAATPLLVTTVTPTGQARARKLFAGRATVAYLPFDLGFAVDRFLRRLRPAALVLVEGDYWPLVLSRVRRDSLPVAVVNGRVGDASFRRLRRLRRLAPGRRLLTVLYAAVHRFGVQTAEDRRRLAALGIDADRLTITGNLKFEAPEPPSLPPLEAALERLAAGRPILLAGSTMAGEEEQVTAAFRAAGGGERALLLLAPRHPERCDDVARLLEAEGWSAVRRSRMAVDGAMADAPAPGGAARVDVVLLDSLGELATLYRLATAAFVGGTLVPSGGHNPLEPSRYGVPTAVGPSMHNFRDMAAGFDAAGAWRRAADAGELAAVWSAWLDDPAAAQRVGARARDLVEENRGALDRSRSLLEPLLAAVKAADATTDGGAPDRRAVQAETGGKP